MRIFLTLFIFLIFFYFFSYSQSLNYANTAKIETQKSLILNSSYYSQYILSDKTEIHSKLAFFIVSPNLGIKHNFFKIYKNYNRKILKKYNLYLTGLSYIYFPTLLLKYLSFYKYYSFETFDFNKRMIFINRNELIISIEKINKRGCNSISNIFSLKFGGIYSIFDKNNDFVNYYSALIYKNTVFLSKSNLYYLGLNYDTKLIGGIYIKIGEILYLDNYKSLSWIFENTFVGYGYFDSAEKIRFSLGLKFLLSNNIYLKPQISIFAGISYRIKINSSKNKTKLFNNKMFKPSKYRDLF